MLSAAAPYLVSISAMLFAGLTAVTVIYTVSHVDPPDDPSPRVEASVGEEVTV
jgi:hypothetical protein